MKITSNLLLIIAALILNLNSYAQPVAKNIIVEHFTNSYCSVCASRNPGFYNNLWQFPQVIHIAYHPSSPYASCPINQHNKTENDARTNYYGVYGATPRLVIQGSPIPASSDYTSATLFQNEQGQTTPFEITTTMQALNEYGGYMQVIIRKKDASSVSSAYLYAAIVEDTLFFNANNGETKHYDVFRKVLWGADVAMPVNVGDSVVYTENFSINSQWETPRVYGVAVLQGSDKKVIQVNKSNHFASTLGVAQYHENKRINIYPNPASDKIRIEGLNSESIVTISDMSGRSILTGNIDKTNREINISQLPKGVYILKLNGQQHSETLKFVKQ